MEPTPLALNLKLNSAYGVNTALNLKLNSAYGVDTAMNFKLNSAYGVDTAMNFKLNSAYGVAAADDNPYHVYDTIPDESREYEVLIKESQLQAPIQPPTHNDESRQQVHDVEGSNGGSDYYVNDP